ncbi:MAG: flagellar basal-body rod protein FlgG [Myxococcota bacterium]
MLRSLYTAATGMQAQQLRLDITAHNLANASTTGFKKGRADFEDLLSETIRPATGPQAGNGGSPTPLEVGLGTRLSSTTRFLAQGDMVATNNPLDVSIEGNGFFAVQRPNGDAAFTRAGNFRVDATGRLVTAHGDLVEPGITVPQEALSVAIKPDGVVQAQVPGRGEPVQLGVLELVTFTNPGGLESMGNNLLRATEASGEPQRVRPGEDGTGALAQGYLEGSNVEAATEMIDMIVTQRAFEMSSKVIQTTDQMLQKLTNLR